MNLAKTKENNYFKLFTEYKGVEVELNREELTDVKWNKKLPQFIELLENPFGRLTGVQSDRFIFYCTAPLAYEKNRFLIKMKEFKQAIIKK